jgi:hypothetical protein
MPVPSQGHYGFHSFPVVAKHKTKQKTNKNVKKNQNIRKQKGKKINKEKEKRWRKKKKITYTGHFFRNACTKSGSLRFSQFSGC